MNSFLKCQFFSLNAVLDFDFFGLRCRWKSDPGHHRFQMQINRKIAHEIDLVPEKWHKFEIYCDYTDGSFSFLIDRKIVWKHIPLKTEGTNPMFRDTITIKYSDFLDEIAWLDEIKIVYVHHYPIF